MLTTEKRILYFYQTIIFGLICARDAFLIWDLIWELPGNSKIRYILIQFPMHSILEHPPKIGLLETIIIYIL